MALTAGAQLRGSWNNNIYRIINKIGEGSFGTVFLVEKKPGKPLALKLSSHVISITNEHRALERLKESVQLRELGALPHLLDVDDCTMENNLYRFLVLEYLEGKSLAHCLTARGCLAESQIVDLLINLGRIIQCFHQEQLVLGDIKPANIIYQQDQPLKLIDLGGVTSFGQLVEEFTPILNRQSWGMGSSIAEPSYDIFSCCLLGMLLATGPRKISWVQEQHRLEEELLGLPWDSELKELVWQGLSGKISSIENLVSQLEVWKNISLESRKVGVH